KHAAEKDIESIVDRANE
nr:hypothetical protein [Tanacetum cinerariifolium]